MTLVRVCLAALGAAVIIVATGCATAPRKAQHDPNDMFLTATAQDSMSEVAASRLALQRSQNPEVRGFAQMMIDDHDRTNRELTRVANQKGLPTPARPDKQHNNATALLSNLSGAEFDREYMGLMVSDHAKLLARVENKAQTATDPDVRTFAAGQIAVIRNHLNMARHIEEGLTGVTYDW